MKQNKLYMYAAHTAFRKLYYWQDYINVVISKFYGNLFFIGENVGENNATLNRKGVEFLKEKSQELNDSQDTKYYAQFLLSNLHISLV